MTPVDLLFPVLGEALPTDHAYLLYGALSSVIPEFHDPDGGLRFAAINGQRGPKGQIRLNAGSRLRVRLPTDRVATALPLAGKALSIGDHRIRLGVPQVMALVPAPIVQARIVTFKNALDAESFLASAQAGLKKLGIAAVARIPPIEQAVIIPGQPNRKGEPRRMVLRVKGKRIIGYSLLVSALTAQESVHLQEWGLGGRKRLGAGLFVPAKDSKP
jgi:CRISPR-associated protein Cas6